MTPNPITVCLFTSTKGHFGRCDIYRQTVSSLLAQVPREFWGGLRAHIKVSPGEDHLAAEMAAWLGEQGFTVYITAGTWSHGNDTHQHGFLQDMGGLIPSVSTPHFVLLEDDWVVRCYHHSFEYYLYEATCMLRDDCELMQVRIPRFNDEADRIRGLWVKHRIPGQVDAGTMPKAFRHNDYANHPSIMRVRDFRAALRFVELGGGPKHSEHGIAAGLKALSSSPVPFACFNPEHIRVGHCGTVTAAEADNLDLPLLAN